jgi:hypothetical protein
MRCVAVAISWFVLGGCWRGGSGTDTQPVTSNMQVAALDGMTDIQGGAYMLRPGMGTSKGAITNLTSEPGEGAQKRWTFAVDGQAIVIELPGAAVFPAVEGEAVVLEAGVQGGGPNAFGTLEMSDARGALLLAVMALPAGWKRDFGAHVSSRPGDDYDEDRYRVRITATDGSTAEVGDGWRRVTLAGAKYLGTGSGAKRTLHGDAPPDYVGSWLDVALIRER